MSTDARDPWHLLARFAADLSGASAEARPELIGRAAKALLGMDRALLVPIGRTMADLGGVDVNRNELPGREVLLAMTDPAQPLERFLPTATT